MALCNVTFLIRKTTRLEDENFRNVGSKPLEKRPFGQFHFLYSVGAFNAFKTIFLLLFDYFDEMYFEKRASYYRHKRSFEASTEQNHGSKNDFCESR